MSLGHTYCYPWSPLGLVWLKFAMAGAPAVNDVPEKDPEGFLHLLWGISSGKTYIARRNAPVEAVGVFPEGLSLEHH